MITNREDKELLKFVRESDFLVSRNPELSLNLRSVLDPIMRINSNVIIIPDYSQLLANDLTLKDEEAIAYIVDTGHDLIIGIPEVSDESKAAVEARESWGRVLAKIEDRKA